MKSLDFKSNIYSVWLSVSYGKLVTYMNDGTNLKSVREIRRSKYPEYNLGNNRTAKLNILFGCTCEAS